MSVEAGKKQIHLDSLFDPLSGEVGHPSKLEKLEVGPPAPQGRGFPRRLEHLPKVIGISYSHLNQLGIPSSGVRVLCPVSSRLVLLHCFPASVLCTQSL